MGTEAEAEAEIEAVGTSSPIAIAAGDGTRRRRIENRRLQIAGVSVTPEVAAIALVYFVQGILGLSRLAKEFFVRTRLGLDPAAASLIFTVSSFPGWSSRSGASSATPCLSSGYRRKSYLALCGVLGTVGGVALATVVDDVPSAAVAFTLGSLSTAFADVVIDGVVVARARRESPAAGARAAVAVLGLGGFRRHPERVLQRLAHRDERYEVRVRSHRDVPAAHRVRRRVRPEDPARDAEEGTNESKTSPRRRARVRSLGTTLWSVGKRRAIWAPALFVFLWQATPNPGTAMFYFQTNELGFQPEFLGRVALARAVAALAGVFLYNAYLKKTPLKKMFFGSAVSGASLGLTQLVLVTGLNREWGIDDRLFSLGDSVLLTVLGEISFLPVLVLAARVCPAGVEATLFAALMSVFNAGGVVSGALGAALTSALGVTSENFDNLFWLVLVCNLSSLAPLAGLGWLDEAPEDDEPGGAPGGAAPRVARNIHSFSPCSYY